MLCMSLNWILVTSTVLWWNLVRKQLSKQTDNQPVGGFTQIDFYMDD